MKSKPSIITLLLIIVFSLTACDVFLENDKQNSSNDDETLSSDEDISNNDISLLDIDVSDGILSPNFDKEITDYSILVDSDVASITISGVVESDKETITYSTSNIVDLTTTNETIIITVTHEDGETTKDYTVDINRVISTNANLTNIDLSYGVLNPDFDSSQIDYTVDVAYSIETFTATATSSSPWATIVYSPSFNVPISSDSTTSTISVTAEDGTIKEYNIIINRLEPSDDVSALNLSSSSGTVTTGTESDYLVDVLYSTEDVTIDLNPTHDFASVEYDKSMPMTLEVGENILSATITAEDGESTQDYNIIINRASPSNNAYLSSILPDSGTLTPDFDSSVFSYTIDVDYSDRIFSMNYHIDNDYATVSSNKEWPFTLEQGENEINITVLAEDGLTEEVYSVTVTCLTPSSVVTLSDISVSEGSLYPTFDSDITEYTVDVPADTIYFYANATATQVGASIIDNSSVTSNGQNYIYLIDDPDYVDLIVTGEDGITTKTYRVNVNRLQGSFTLQVLDYETDDPISGATVTVDNGNIYTTDSNGYFTMINNEYFTVQAEGYDKGVNLKNDTVYKRPIYEELIKTWTCSVHEYSYPTIYDYDISDIITFNSDGTYSRSGDVGTEFDSRDFRMKFDDDDGSYYIGYYDGDSYGTHHGSLSHQYVIPVSAKSMSGSLLYPISFSYFEIEDDELVLYTGGSEGIYRYGEVNVEGKWYCHQEQDGTEVWFGLIINADGTFTNPSGTVYPAEIHGSDIYDTPTTTVGSLNIIDNDNFEMQYNDLFSDDLWWSFTRVDNF